ncbi:MAG: cbb3-type cytochrome c oxidase subunit 3 [Planctomycetota bacterium]
MTSFAPILAQLGSGETGLLVFMGLFVVVVVYAFRKKNQATFEQALEMPLDADEALPRTPREDGDAGAAAVERTTEKSTAGGQKEKR